MPIPPVTHFRVPLFQLLGDGVERPLHEAANALADVFKLAEEERSAVLPSGYPVVRHRTGWAGFHLRKAGLVDDSKRGILCIREERKKVLATKPTGLSYTFLGTLFKGRDEFLAELRQHLTALLLIFEKRCISFSHGWTKKTSSSVVGVL
ncbi:MAG: winged helix-turn-helix domain-containing protein, partial [Verrucomicrobia bacterium]|nr:winged helix-turn-helix domain-containing protein [Verrucomicrobiota bacterium]